MTRAEMDEARRRALEYLYAQRRAWEARLEARPHDPRVRMMLSIVTARAKGLEEYHAQRVRPKLLEAPHA